MAFGSDWDVAPLSPILGIDAAVTRATIDGKQPGGWVPEQKIGPEEALKAYTVTAAYAAFEEKDKGSLEVGKLGDFVVLSGDPLAVCAREAPGRSPSRRPSSAAGSSSRDGRASPALR